MPPSDRDEVIFGFTEKEVKFLLMSLKCIETHGNRRFLNCARLAENTGYSPAYAHEYYMNHLLQKIIALPPVNLTDGSDNQKELDTAKPSASQVPTPAAGKDRKADPRDRKNENQDTDITNRSDYKGIGGGMDGVAGDPEDERELEALGSAYAWDC